MQIYKIFRTIASIYLLYFAIFDGAGQRRTVPIFYCVSLQSNLDYVINDCGFDQKVSAGEIHSQLLTTKKLFYFGNKRN